MQLIAKPPLATSAGSVYPYAKEIQKKLTYAGKFEDQGPIEQFLIRNDHIWVPRGVAPISPEDQRSIGGAIKVQNLFKARNPEQSRVCAEAVALAHAGASFIIQAPTGFGKTYIGANLIGAYGRRALIIVTKEDIKRQWITSLCAVLGITEKEIGLIQGDRYDISEKPVSIAMIQSVSKMDRYPKWVYRYFGLLLVDEVHRMGADQFRNVAWQITAKVRIGLSATPERKDGRDIVFRQHLGPVRVKASDLPMTPVIRFVPSGYTCPKIPHSNGRTMLLAKIMARSVQRNYRICSIINQSVKAGRNVVIFSDILQHLRSMASTLRAETDITHAQIGFYVGGLTEQKRDKEKRKPVVFATYQMASEATDVPWWDTCILATPKSNVAQIVGRILREYPDKKQPVVFDLMDQGSAILYGYTKSRRRWYLSIGAKMIGFT